MKKFIITIIFFVTLIISLYVIVSFISKPTNPKFNDFVTAMIDKHKRVDQLNHPKIIFAGGSNLVFSLNCEEIEKEFSVPVVNLGLHAGFGLDFILNELKYTIKRGDIVFLSIEYYLPKKGIYRLQNETSDKFKEARKYYPYDFKKEIVISLDKTRANIKSHISDDAQEGNLDTSSVNNVYSRAAFNKYGDNIAHLNKPSSKELVNRGLLSYKYWEGINELNKFYDYAKSKNCDVFFIYPTYPISEYEKSKDALDRLSIDLTNNLKFETLNKPKDFAISDSLFFDSVYHLNKMGREYRTQKTIEIIKSCKNTMLAINKIRN